MNVEEKEALLLPACVLLDLKSSSFSDCLHEFLPLVKSSQAVLDTDLFLQEVQQREQSSSTNTGRGIAFPHARTHTVSKLFVAIGRSRAGINFEAESAPVHLMFLIGTPPGEIATYLECMSWLAARARNTTAFDALLQAETPEEFIATMQGDR
ncbi:MAG: PTS sugar transporter subunit IIA [Chthoniobacterales bacterium]